MSARPMSIWGWGYADKFPDQGTRKSMGEQVGQMLGLHACEPSDPAPFDGIHLAPPRLTPPASLAEFCSADKRQRMTHTYGKSFIDLVRGFEGDYRSAPDIVAIPRNEAEINGVLDWAASANAAVIAFGGGTSVVAGIEPKVTANYQATISLDTRAMGRVLEVDPVSRAARIQAGATGPALEQQLAPHGVTLRHYPQSFEFSTLGGWIATRSGGHYATMHTHIDDFVESLRMLTPAGVMETRRLPASGAGPSPDRLMIGSEGILGVITEAWMRVQHKPRYRSSASMRFIEFNSAVDAVRTIAQAGLYPANCRLLDAREGALHAVTTDGSAVLLLGFESADHAPDAAMDRAVAIAKRFGGTCPDGVVKRDTAPTPNAEDAAENWKQAFFEAPYLQNTMVSLGMIADTFETACTWDRFETLHTAVIENVRAAMKRVCGKGFISCRFTHVYPDGPAPYYTFIAPSRPGGQIEQWAEIKKAASDTLITHGATITHHHAVGRTHRPGYDRQRSDLFAKALAAAKKSVDPGGILNPGVLIEP
jgi:alkyldihydroxyacetonephosphate synthase